MSKISKLIKKLIHWGDAIDGGSVKPLPDPAKPVDPTNPIPVPKPIKPKEEDK